MRIEKESVRLALNDPSLLYPFIEGVESDARCTKFLLEFMTAKSDLHESCTAESLRVLRILQARNGCKSSSRIPYSPSRVFLCQMWAQIPASVPPHLVQEGKLLNVLFRWLETSPVGEGSDRQLILRILKSQRKQISSAIEFNMKILSLFFGGVLRSARFTDEGSDSLYFPENLQLVLPLIESETLPICLFAVFEDFGFREIIAMYTTLISWTPLCPAKEKVHMSKLRFEGSVYPLFAFLNTFIRVAAKVSQSSRKGVSFAPDWRVVVETQLRIIAAKLANKALIADASELLVYLLKVNVPGRKSKSFLYAGAEKCMVPVVESILRFAETIFNRETMLGKSSDILHANEPLEFLSSLIRILQEDIQSLSIPGSASPDSSLPLLSVEALEAARLASIGAKPIPLSVPIDSNLSVPSLSLLVPSIAVPVPSSNTYAPIAQGVEVALRKDVKFAGIQNFNNTCYLSSFLQALFLTDGFLVSIFGFNLQKLGKTEEADFVQGTKVLSSLQLVFSRLLETHHPYIEISECIRSLPPSYRSGEQQDVTESGRWILDKLGGSEQSLVKSVFGGEMIHKTKCLGCNTVTERREVFTDLCVSVPKQAEVLGKKRVTVQSLIKNMLKPESLSGDNRYSCETCGKKQDASRWIELTQLPNHLMLVMHKFSFDVASCDFKKETTPVHTEDGVIDLVPSAKYELYCSILHYGESAMKGHYVACGKRSSSGLGHQKWALMDDSNVTMLEEAEAIERITGLHKATDSAYVLFFRSVNAPVAPQLRIPKHLIDEARAIEAAAVHL